MIYLDNAATTPMNEEVIKVMHTIMRDSYGNPSSTHGLGRKSRGLIETARKSIADQFNVSPAEIIFTSSGTEADNLILYNAVKNLGVQRIITSRIEHHAVLNVVKMIESENQIEVVFVNIHENGMVDLEHLEDLLREGVSKTLVSLMHINNEIGNILPIQKVANMVKEYNGLFHSDTVQTIGHYPLNLSEIPVDFIVGSAHKFHGPKGVGFAFIRKGLGVVPMLLGGNQEKGARSSTENLYAIVGMAKALELSMSTVERDMKYIKELKSYCISKLKRSIKNIAFNGNSENLEGSSCTILNVILPAEYPMLLFQLDINGIAVSGGSACQSGSQTVSHVLKELNPNTIKKTSLRISFSKQNTKNEVDRMVETLNNLI